VSDALDYHRATNVAPETESYGMDPAWTTTAPGRLEPFHEYGEAERLPLETSVAGRLLQDGAGIVRSQEGRYYGGGTMHWRAYSSAGGLFPVEAYIAAPDGLYSFDPLSRALVRMGDDNARAAVSQAVDAEGATFVVLTGIHARTGWKYGERGYRHVWWDAGTMLANLLALAAADDLAPRLYTAFVDRELNEAVGSDGIREYTLAVLALERAAPDSTENVSNSLLLPRPNGARFALAEAAHAAGELSDLEAVRAWRTEPDGDEPRLDRHTLARGIRERSSVRKYSDKPLAREELAELLAWSEAPIPADAPRVVEQIVTVANVEGLEPGIYDAQLNLLHPREEQELREQAGFVAMEQDHPRHGAVNVFQMTDLEAVVADLGDRGYRWAQLEAGIRAGRLQVGAFMHGWGAAASTFFDEEVSRFLQTPVAPLLMVAIGARG
jgi:SagB-type dehydrogenase family enzyme